MAQLQSKSAPWNHSGVEHLQISTTNLLMPTCIYSIHWKGSIYSINLKLSSQLQSKICIRYLGVEIRAKLRTAFVLWAAFRFSTREKCI